MKGKTITEIQIGDQAYFEKTISESDIYMYAGITGDLNPVHINRQVAEKSFFKKRIAHGMLSAGLISAVLGMQLPGPGTIYLEQELKFMKPVYIGDTIKAIVVVKEKLVEKNIVILETVCINQNNENVLKGRAVVMPPK